MISRDARSLLLLSLAMSFMACAPVGDDSDEDFSADEVTARACPEFVVRDGRGDPRNAAGQIRYCWPGERRCHCDADNDCYALPGRVACRAVAAPRDAGVSAPTPVSTPTPRPAASTPTPTTTPVTSSPSRVWGATAPASIPTFPGAEGFGASASGGRGGRVIAVTNLNASGPGSLQAALDESGPRTVVFKVSGVIQSSVHIAHGDVTIAGQTSPGGITVRGIDTTEEPYCDQQCGNRARGVDNVVIRHLRSRPAGGDFPDGLRLRYARWVMVDHVSIGNAEDEAVEISYANNITLQNTIIAETVGGHADRGGVLINYTNPAAGFALDRIALLRNHWNRIMGRFPELSRESGSAAAGTTMQIEISNNLFWDQHYYADINPTIQSGNDGAAAIFYQLNHVGNSSFVRPGYRYGMLYFPNPTGRSSAFISNDTMNIYPNRTDWALEYCCNDLPTRPATRAIPNGGRVTRHNFPAVSTMPASMVQTFVGANAGAFPRDPMDTRLVSFVQSGRIDTRAANVNPANDALRTAFTTAPAAPADADNDGMPDDWERANGLNPAAQDHNGTQLSVARMGRAGYTNLEVYLEELSARRVMTNR
ncbi:MAG: hypothetical protein R3A48_11595 [Polyangiales bacterium]